MKIKFIVLLLLISSNVFAQGVDNLWVMGYESGSGPPFGGINMDFTGGNLTINYLFRNMNFGETNGVICDKNGKVLFTSNGIYIANTQNDTMVNGKGLNP